ncbi:hypothetical protein M8312_02495 [Sphingomonas sp. KRR8]|uniref:SMP-30/gluconolactonase/LRE family protein n=1 Tax=Sphingomonas sp. KRR8 TaxID=2942996 RepID=UPI0020220112|nr:hypothetical protein [Sphingomonas sp. KRR8]URD61403.1 hypothetical protein M8312_02495 [Sphingomonas sp. KRR8]
MKRVLLAVPVALAGVGMLAATMVPFLAFFSAALSVVALAAVHTGARLASARGAFLISGTIGAAALAVAVFQPLGLKVLLLPKAAALPFEAAPSKVVKLYPEGVWFEGIAAGPDGTLYLAANRNLDFSAARYYRDAVGEVIARASDGKERTLFRTPLGTTAGVIAVDSDGTLYMTSNGDAPAIWRIQANGRASKLATLPAGAWPNGIDFGPDGMLYSPDSNLARVWRIDPRSGEATIAVEDKRLAARPYIALAPGANGLHFAGRDMIITVSDSTEVLRYRLGEDGRFDRAALVANGLPGDDFAIGHDGSLFITTHPYNTLVRVAPDGRRTIIASEKQQVIGATDAVFGRGSSDEEILYVVTDGGAFTGGPKTRGALIAIKPYAR